MSTIAIIPARSGSKRVPGKNIRLLAGHPLLSYSIAAARQSQVVDRVLVSTDSSEIADIAVSYGAEVPGLRPESLSHDAADDFSWFSYALENWVDSEPDQLWVLLRPTSPLRSASSIAQAHRNLLTTKWADSIRALRPVTEHPGKMWRMEESGEATTYLEQGGAYNGPTQALEPLYVQASSLEIVRRSAAELHQSIAGQAVLGMVLPGEESRDVNSELDWDLIEKLVSDNPSLLPQIYG